MLPLFACLVAPVGLCTASAAVQVMPRTSSMLIMAEPALVKGSGDRCRRKLKLWLEAEDLCRIRD
ncbi:hypothetical protein AOV_03650 [Anaplasma ovis str. Haibei]|uniref:Uncharacterized protein n=1 Tax=Anaplasma ovis str. Haibei TaxID=1248439 RepID=A0A2Z2LF70_9RICK|nr:hypothetical protein AOV_03645 [Anaplasma ovis str. Haibei]ASI47891.1 hypothetical protein AOV_03650 [Anaplasma ovis str. Haibei]